MNEYEVAIDTNEMIVKDTKFLIDTIRKAPAAAAGRIGCTGYCMSELFDRRLKSW
ncbi:MAG: dienelactone hydrolase [Halioglobus sp.]|jgi:hypothetical protein